MSGIKKYFGIKIRKLRKSRGLTQERLSEFIGINQRQLTRIETGKSYPSFQTLELLCVALEVEAHELFDFRDCEGYTNSGNISSFDIIERVQQMNMYPQKLNFLELALASLDGDGESLLKMQFIIEGMLLLNKAD